MDILELGGSSPSLQDIPWDSFKQVPEQTKVCCPEVQACSLSALFPSLRILSFNISWTL